MRQALSVWLTAGLLIVGFLLPLSAQARHCWTDNHGRVHCDQGLHRGWTQYRDTRNRNALVDWKTKKVLKGGLIGAGVGAGAGALLDKNVGKTAILGAGIGAGTQAVRYSNYMRRHPVVKTAAYGTLAGAGASQLTRHGSIAKGSLWGAAIGTGVGAFRHMD